VRGAPAPWRAPGSGLRSAGAFAHILVAPLHQTRECDLEVAALLGEPVLEALGPLAVADPLEDPFLDQPVEPLGEDVAGDPKALLELFEAAQSKEGIAHDQQRPALADDLKRACNRAVLAFVVAFQHGVILTKIVASRN
jgi:hypothetical protein